MTDKRVLQIGQVRLLLDGPLPEPDERYYLRRFLADGSAPQSGSVRIRLCRKLPAPEGVCLQQRWNFRVFETPDAFEIWHESGKPTERFFYARLRCPKQTPDDMELDYCTARLPYSERRLLSVIAIDRFLHRHGCAVLHCAWVDRGGKALLFSGPSGIGKSTQADLWAQLRAARICNGDRAAICRTDSGLLCTGTPYSGSSEFCENCTMPIRAIVMLRQAPENRLRRMDTAEATRQLMAQISVQSWDMQDLQRTLDFAAQLAQTVPVYAFACRRDASAVELLDRTLSEED